MINPSGSDLIDRRAGSDRPIRGLGLPDLFASLMCHYHRYSPLDSNWAEEFLEERFGHRCEPFVDRADRVLVAVLDRDGRAATRQAKFISRVVIGRDKPFDAA